MIYSECTLIYIDCTVRYIECTLIYNEYAMIYIKCIVIYSDKWSKSIMIYTLWWRFMLLYDDDACTYQCILVDTYHIMNTMHLILYTMIHVPWWCKPIDTTVWWRWCLRSMPSYDDVYSMLFIHTWYMLNDDVNLLALLHDEDDSLWVCHDIMMHTLWWCYKPWWWSWYLNHMFRTWCLIDLDDDDDAYLMHTWWCSWWWE